MSRKQEARQARLADLKASLVGLRGMRCERCQLSQTWLDLHHLLSRARGGQDVAENLALLCRPCHQSVTALACPDWRDWVWSARAQPPR